MCEVQDWVLVILTLMCSVGRVTPRRLADDYAGQWYSLLMLLISILVGVSGAHSLDHVGRWSILLMPFRLMLGLAYLWPPAVVLWNCVYAASASSAYLRVLGDASAEHVYSLQCHCILEAMTLACVVIVAVTYRALLQRELSSMAEACSARDGQVAMRRLLELVCDVVVGLDSELVIAEHTPRLSTMVAVPPGTTVQGARLQDFMASEEDKRRFERLLLASQLDVEAPTGSRRWPEKSMEFASRTLGLSADRNARMSMCPRVISALLVAL